MADDTGLENELLDDSVEAGERSYTFCAGNETVESAADGTSHLWNQEGCGPATEAELEEYFNSANNLQETFGDFETYMEYMNRREDLIDSGEYDPGSWGDVVDTGGLSYQDPYGNYIDPNDYNNLSPNDFASKYGLDKSEVQVIEVDTTKSRQDGYNEWLESEAVQELNAEYGIDNTLRTEDGREYQWNGTGWVKVTEPDNMDFGRILKLAAAIAGSAVTGNALGPIIGGAIGGAAGSAAGAGAISGAISSSLGQIIVNGEINPEALLQAMLLGGIGGIANASIAGELSGTALDNAIWDLSGAMGMSYEEVVGLLEGIANGVITGDELSDIALGAVGGWSQVQVMDFLRDSFSDGFVVEDWFKDGASNIPVEALEPIIDQIIGGVADGSIADPAAWLGTVWDYFSSGGDIDFMLPDGLDIGGLFELGNFDFSLCDESRGENWWYCNVDWPEWGITLPGLPDIDIDLPDVDIDLPDVVECMEGWEWSDLLEKCVEIPDIDLPDVVECMEGWEWDDLLKECVKLPDVDLPDVVECMEGWEWDDLLNECVKLPDIDIDCPAGWDRDADGICIEPPNLCQEGYSWDELFQACRPDTNWDVKCPVGWDRDEDGVCIEPSQLCEEGYSWDILRGCIPDTEDVEDPEDPDGDLDPPDVDIDIDLPEGPENNYVDYNVGPRARQYAYDPFKPVEAQPVREFEHLLTNPLLDETF